MNFSDALDAMKYGKKITRNNWDGRFLEILEPGPNAELTERYIVKDNDGKRMPWCADHTELLADDWDTL